MVDIKDFGKLELRVGTIVSAEDFSEAINPAYKLIIDFGSQGKKCSSAQITKNYSVDELPGHQVIAVFNLGKKNNWRILLDKKLAKKIERRFKNEMSELGYL